MLDWRAALATGLVHAGAAMVSTMLTLGSTVIVCFFGQPGDPFAVERADSFPLRVVDVPYAPPSTDAERWPLVLAPDRCGAAEELVRRPALEPGGASVIVPDGARPPVLCLRVDRAGRVVSARVHRSSGSAAFDRRTVRAARAARFRAGRPGRVTITAG